MNSMRTMSITLAAFLLSACGGPSVKVQANCPTPSGGACSFLVQKPVGDRHFSPHMVVYYDDIIRFEVFFASGVRLAELGTTRVPFDQVSVRPLSKGMEVGPLKTGYVQLDRIANVLTIHLFTEQGSFAGNGIFPLGGP